MKGLAFLFALVCAGQTLAQPAASKPPPKPEPSAAAGSTAVRPDPAESRRLFRELDRNRDGYLSPDELATPRAREFNWAAVDRNRDGRISEPEFTVLQK